MPYKNPEDKLRWQREYCRNNREEVRKYHRDYVRERRRNDIEFAERLRQNHKRWRDNHPEYKRKPKKVNAKNRLNGSPHLYPLDDKCAFCGATENLEHGHIDYDYPELYLTVCHRCNLWMDKPLEVS